MALLTMKPSLSFTGVGKQKVRSSDPVALPVFMKNQAGISWGLCDNRYGKVKRLTTCCLQNRWMQAAACLLSTGSDSLILRSRLFRIFGFSINHHFCIFFAENSCILWKIRHHLTKRTFWIKNVSSPICIILLGFSSRRCYNVSAYIKRTPIPSKWSFGWEPSIC